MKIAYVTAFEGVSEENWGLYSSQVINNIVAYNSVNRLDTMDLIVFTTKKQSTERLIKCAAEKNIHLHVVTVKSIVRYIPLFATVYGVETELNFVQYECFVAREITASFLISSQIEKKGHDALLVVDKRGMPEHEALSQGSRTKLYRYLKFLIMKWLTVKVMSKCSNYRFVTSNLCKHYRKLIKNDSKWSVVIQPTSVISYNEQKNKSHPFGNSKSPDDAIRIVYVGGMAEYQKFYETINAFNKLCVMYENGMVQPIIITSINSDEEINKIKRTLPTNTHILNKISHMKVINILNSCDYGIILRDNILINEVAAPTKIAEYLMSGLGVIYGGKIGLIEEVVDRYDDHTIVEISSLFNKKQVLKKRSDNDRIVTQNISREIFSAETQVKKLSEYIHREQECRAVQR